MTTRTMVYKAATDATDAARLVENEHGKWEWQIVELEDGDSAPNGWKLLPEVLGEPPKAKRGKIKLPAEPDVTQGEADGNSDGN